MNPDTAVTTEPETADRYLDCKGLRCPLPIVKVSRAIKEMAPGQTLRVEADDPAFRSDLEAWARTTGHELLEFTDEPILQARLRKS